MPATKKDIRNKKNKILEAQGLRVPLTHSGVPVKEKKPSYTCRTCKKELTHINFTTAHMNQHPKNTFAECFPGVAQPSA
ncbi:UNVERIFIED_CONTAM: hypothetical protein HDU68_003317 [Siphonaria sp. JEL0065]|nr:hypothetical protein HDU68_003317 [Siphonaria sp. JEL0065]